MISVTIFINNVPVATRTARCIVEADEYITDKKLMYNVDDGSVILHKPKDGAIKLAKKMLDTIHEV